MTLDDDATQVQKLAVGDHAAFRGLVERHQADVARFCLRYTQSRAAAADLTQEVFVTLWNERQRYRHDGRLRAYLLAIARNRCLAHNKRRGRLVVESTEEREASERSDIKTLGRQLEVSLSTLQPELAEVVVLRYLEGLELGEIAELTDAPLGTVKSRLHRALGHLRRYWHD